MSSEDSKKPSIFASLIKKSNSSSYTDKMVTTKNISKNSFVPEPVLSELSGVVSNIRMWNDWGIATLWTDDYKEIKLIGTAIKDLIAENEYIISAKKKMHPKYGESYDVISSKPYIKNNMQAIIKFISSTYKGIGIKSAEKFVKKIFEKGGDPAISELRDTLLNKPWEVDFSIIKREGVFDGDEKDKTIQSFIQRDLATRITGNGFTFLLFSNLAKYLTEKLKDIESTTRSVITNPIDKAWEILSKNPYLCISKVDGYGFLMADHIGLKVGIKKDAPIRLSAMVKHAVNEECERFGHSYLNKEQVYAGISKMDSTIDPKIALEFGLMAKSIQIDNQTNPVKIYSAKLLDAETNLANRIATLCMHSFPLMKSDKNLDEKIKNASSQLNGTFIKGLDDSQNKALKGILTSSTQLHTITAEPGSGKTAVMEVLAKLMKDKKFLFCAPTGKGAKVLNNRVKNLGLIATTIHTMLRGSPGGEFLYNKDNKLEADILVIDEGSMPDLELASALFEAIDDDTHVIVLGDVDQLPSIAPGRVLADLLEISSIDHHRLTTVHRNSGGILDVIREVKAGKIIPKNRESVTFSGDLPLAEEGFEKIAQEYVKSVAKHGFEGTALLMSKRKGLPDEPGWNTTYANAYLKQMCNAEGQKISGTTFSLNDRIIIKSNMAFESNGVQERVVNGDTGSIISFEAKTSLNDHGIKTLGLKLDDGRIINYPGDSIQSLQLAYALTVHAAQGSEYPNVIAVVTPGGPTFINRNMLYTGLSRARQSLSVHANNMDIRRVSETMMPGRNSMLVERVNTICENINDNDRNDDEDNDYVSFLDVPRAKTLMPA